MRSLMPNATVYATSLILKQGELHPRFVYVFLAQEIAGISGGVVDAASAAHSGRQCRPRRGFGQGLIGGLLFGDFFGVGAVVLLKRQQTAV